MATDDCVMPHRWDYSHTSLWLLPPCSQAHPEGIWATLVTETCFLWKPQKWEARGGGGREMRWECVGGNGESSEIRLSVWEINWDMGEDNMKGEGSLRCIYCVNAGEANDSIGIKKSIAVISSEGRRFVYTAQIRNRRREFVIHIQKCSLRHCHSVLLYSTSLTPGNHIGSIYYSQLCWGGLTTPGGLTGLRHKYSEFKMKKHVIWKITFQ